MRYDWIISLIFFCSVTDTSVAWRRWRFRLVDLDDSMWLRNALWRLNFPEAVRLNRFLAALSDFIFGMASSYSFVDSGCLASRGFGSPAVDFPSSFFLMVR